jgi:hypothetical protein
MPDDQDSSTGPAFDGDWQRLWFSLTRPWTSLAVVPADPETPAWTVAEGLLAVGRRSGKRAVHLLNATDARLEDIESVIEAVNAMTHRGDLVLVAVNPIASHPASLPIIRATSAALLVVRLADSHLADARNTVRAIGQDRVLGSVVLG